MISSTARRLSTASTFATHGRPTGKALLRKARERRDLQHRQQDFDMARRRESRRHSRRSSIQQDRCHRIAVWLLLPNVVMIILGSVMTLCSYFEAIGFGTIFWRPDAHNVFHWLGPLVLLGGCVAMFVNYMLYKRQRTGIYRLVSKRLSLPYSYDQISHRGSCCHSTSASLIDPTSSIVPCSTRSSFSLPRSPGSFTASASLWGTGSHLAVKATPSGLSENDEVTDDEDDVTSRKRILQSQDSSGWRAFSLDVVSWQEGKPDFDSVGDATSASHLLSPRRMSTDYHDDLRSPQFFTGKFKSIFAFEDPRLAEVQFAEDIRGFPDNNNKGKSYKKHKKGKEIKDYQKTLPPSPLLDDKLIVDIPTEWITKTDFHNCTNNQMTAAHISPTQERSTTKNLNVESPAPSSSKTEPASKKQTQQLPNGGATGDNSPVASPVVSPIVSPIVLNREQQGAAAPEGPSAAKENFHDFNDLDQFRQSLTEMLMSNETICQNILRDVILKLKTNIDRKVKESPEAGDASALHDMALRTLCKNETEAPSSSDAQSQEVEDIVTNALEETVQDYLVMALVEQEQAPGASSDFLAPGASSDFLDVKNAKGKRMTLPDICRSMPAPGTSGESVSPGSATDDTLCSRASDKEWPRAVSPQRLSNRSSSSDVTKETKSQSSDICTESIPVQSRRSRGVHFQIGANSNDVRPKVRRVTPPRLQRGLAIDIKEKPKDRLFRSKSQEATKSHSSKEFTRQLSVPGIRKNSDNVLNVPKSPLSYREMAQRARSRMRHELRPSMSMPVTSSASPWGLCDAASVDEASPGAQTLERRPSTSASRRCVSLEEHYDVVTSHHVLHALTSFPSIQADDIRVTSSRRRWSRTRSASEGERRTLSIDGERVPNRAGRGRRTRSLEHRHSSSSFIVHGSRDVCSPRPDTHRAFTITTDAVFTEKLPEKLPKIESIDSYFRSHQSMDSDHQPAESGDSYFWRPKSASRHFDVSAASKRRTKSSDADCGTKEGLLQTSL